MELIGIDTVEDKIINENVCKGGMLCSQCSRFYPIIEEIPVMLPDEGRDKEKIFSFYRNGRKKFPAKSLKMETLAFVKGFENREGTINWI